MTRLQKLHRLEALVNEAIDIADELGIESGRLGKPLAGAFRELWLAVGDSIGQEAQH